MSKKTLAESLGLGEKRGPLPPKYQPKIRVRVTNDRTRQVSEFDLEIPLEGFLPDLFPLTQKMRVALEMQGLLPRELTQAPLEKAEEQVSAAGS